MNLATLIRQKASNVALVIGNGINRHRNSEAVNSWDALLIKIAQDCSPDVSQVPKGTALTEFYDLLTLKLEDGGRKLQGEFCELMERWRPFLHHISIMAWAKRHRVPVLTTNFDEILSEAAECGFIRPRHAKFTDHYPWECRFAPNLVEDPCRGFGIWHINGMKKYKRSIRLGLTHYMGSVQHARHWLHRDENRLFGEKDQIGWPGAHTWMHLIFNKPLLIFGLALEENEVFLRWLLIERARYFQKFPWRRRLAWYIFRNDPDDERQAGKLFFLRGLGIECVSAASFDEIYDNPAWGY